MNTTIDEKDIDDLEYILTSVGVNDLDIKDHVQVFDEMKLTIDKIRNKYKIIISEPTPRRDHRDSEVMSCNRLISQYAQSCQDLFIASHENLRDPSWSMFSDNKHILSTKIPRYAANIIKALILAYNI